MEAREREGSEDRTSGSDEEDLEVCCLASSEHVWESWSGFGAAMPRDLKEGSCSWRFGFLEERKRMTEAAEEEAEEEEKEAEEALPG